MCLVETARDSDKVAIAAAAKMVGQFPYAFIPTTNLMTMPTDPTGVDGGVPAPPTSAPCSGIDTDAATACSETCDPPDSGGPVESSLCLTKRCALQFAPLAYGGLQDETCFDCLVYYFTSSNLLFGQSQCATPTQPFAFDGQVSLMMLSHYQLKNTTAFILPGTGYRRAVLYAQAVLEDQSTVDFYCTQLITPLIESSLPYVGNYGKTVLDGSAVIENGWEDEQDLQVEKMIAFIKSNSAKRPAIVAGDWHATQPLDGDAGVVLGSLSPEVVAKLDSAQGGAFVRAEPTPYTPGCNYCPAPANPYNPGILPWDFTPTFLYNFPSNSTIEDSFWGQGLVVPIMATPDEPWSGGDGPLSEFYGRFVRLVRPHQ
jgi:hypothetical protein